MCAARCSGVGDSSASGPRLFSRCSAALARCEQKSPGHWVTGGGGNQGPSPVPGHWVTTPPRGRLSPEVPPSRLGAETESLLLGWGGRRAVSGGYFSLTEDARAERAGQPPPLPTRPRKSPPLGGWPPRPGSPPRATYASPSLTLWSRMTQNSRPPQLCGG